jgi:16S rRNA (cytidine1402-2'-O)-methyltransferase
MDTSKFTFLGFMPQIKKLKEQFLERIIFSQETLIIYESPKRIKSSLNYFNKHIPNRKIAIIRELTKKNEEVVRGTVETVADEFLKRVDIKGELTLIIDGSEIIKKNQFTNDEILSIINLYKKTMTDKEIVLKVSSKFNVAKRKVYQLIIDNK